MQWKIGDLFDLGRACRRREENLLENTKLYDSRQSNTASNYKDHPNREGHRRKLDQFEDKYSVHHVNGVYEGKRDKWGEETGGGESSREVREREEKRDIHDTGGAIRGGGRNKVSFRNEYDVLSTDAKRRRQGKGGENDDTGSVEEEEEEVEEEEEEKEELMGLGTGKNKAFGHEWYDEFLEAGDGEILLEQDTDTRAELDEF